MIHLMGSSPGATPPTAGAPGSRDRPTGAGGRGAAGGMTATGGTESPAARPWVRNPDSNSIGIGKTSVELCSLATSARVCSARSCRAPGDS